MNVHNLNEELCYSITSAGWQLVNIISKITFISLNFKSIDVLQFPHKSYLQKGYFFCVYVVAKKKLLVIRFFQNKILLNKIYLFFSLLQGNLFRHIKNGGNVRFIKRNYIILYKETSQWQDTFLHAFNYVHVDFD